MKRLVACAASSLFVLMLAACGGETSNSSVAESVASDDPEPAIVISEISVDAIAERFVKLGLGLGLHDPAYVDAYHGPEAWRTEVERVNPDLDVLAAEAKDLLEALSVFTSDGTTPREAMLEKLIIAAQTRIRMTSGEVLSFDEEAQLLYDAVPPVYDEATFDAVLAEIDRLLPGEGELSDRVDAFRDSLAIPADKLAAVFDAAIEECKVRTKARYGLPENERFSVGYVTDKPWSGYNWYQGDYESLIEVNTDFPVIIDRAVDLGCHEGYPGHHTWNVMIERDMLNGQGWVEYSLYPLFSPLSLIAEGSANYGIELAFPGEEKIEFERNVLFPLAGLDQDKAETLAALNKARAKLTHARNHIARQFLNKEIDRETAIEKTRIYGLSSRERAEQGVKFIETYRAYVINYNLGRDIVAAYIERDGLEDRWAAFESILTRPVSASDLQ